MTGQAHVLVVNQDSVYVYRLPSLIGLDLEPEATIRPAERGGWDIQLGDRAVHDGNLRGAVAEVLDLFRDNDCGRGDPGDWWGTPTPVPVPEAAQSR